MKSILPIILFAILQIFPLPPSLGQNDWNKTKAQAVAQQAQELATAGQWQQALDYLDENIRAMGTEEKLNSYRAYFLFNKAYLLQAMPGVEESANLKRAQVAYEEALRNQPGDLKILNNLILVSRRRGDWKTAEQYAVTALRLDPENAAKWYIVLGEVQQIAGDPESSWASYSKALDKAPGNREAAQKLLALYDNYDYTSAGRLYRKCLELNENGLPEMAAEGLESITSKICGLDVAVRDSVVLAWAGILAANNWIRPRTEKKLVKMECAYLPLAVLNENISNKWRSELEPSNWWRQSERRKFYYLALQKSWADYLLSTGAKKEAMELYRSARNNLRDVSIDFSKEIYGRSGVLEMELLIQLARLYGDRELDPTGNNFEELEMELFDRKGEAYRSRDLESIQKFHTILAMIYVDRKKWEGGFAQNARFQLTRAISTARERVENDPSLYIPLPHLHKYLGDTYTATGNPDRAADAYLNAAVGYLETDNLEYSQEMIGKAGRQMTAGANETLQAKKNDVLSIFNARKGIAGLDAASFDKNSEGYFRKDQDYLWLDQPERIKSIDASVVNRQTFKVLADLGARANTVGAREESLALRNASREKVREVSVLSSQQDIIRVKQFERSDQLDFRSLYNGKTLEIQDQKKKYEIILPNRSGGEKMRVIDIERTKN